jgi:hypothetical protein
MSCLSPTLPLLSMVSVYACMGVYISLHVITFLILSLVSSLLR